MTATTSLATTKATPDWEYALCAQTDPGIFFPTGKGGQITNAVTQAKGVCSRCPIRKACLEWALETAEPAGVWGGMDEHERRQGLGVVESQMDRCWERREWIEERRAAGVSMTRLAKAMGVSVPTMVRCIAQFEQERAVSARKAVTPV